MNQIEILPGFYLAALPIFVLSAGSLLAMLQSVSPTFCKTRAVGLNLLISLAVALGLAFWLLGQGDVSYLGGSFISEDLARLGQIFILGIATVTALLFWETGDKERFFRGEVASLFMMIVVGMLVMVAANELISIFIGLELSSIGLYALVGYVRPSQRSAEGAIKYFVLGSFAAAFLLFGFALIYAGTGTVRLAELLDILPRGGEHFWVLLGIMFTVAGLSFKLALVPFHAWAPDAYEAAPTGISGFMATSVKVMILIVTMRFISGGAHTYAVTWMPAMMFLAILSMIFGNLLALVQTSLKRMLAYSSIAHSGYLAIALCAIGASGGSLPIEAITFYLLGYALVSLATFGTLMWLEGKTVENIQLDDIAGLAKSHPWASAALAVFMFSFAGMPPTVGFITKFFVFNAALTGHLYGLVIVGVIGTAISLFYYLRVLVKLFMSDKIATGVEIAPTSSTVLSGLATAAVALILLLGTVLPQPVLTWLKMP